jgi:hypothetical protein
MGLMVVSQWMHWLNDNGGVAAWVALPLMVFLTLFPLLFKKFLFNTCASFLKNLNHDIVIPRLFASILNPAESRWHTVPIFLF